MFGGAPLLLLAQPNMAASEENRQVKNDGTQDTLPFDSQTRELMEERERGPRSPNRRAKKGLPRRQTEDPSSDRDRAAHPRGNGIQRLSIHAGKPASGPFSTFEYLR